MGRGGTQVPEVKILIHFFQMHEVVFLWTGGGGHGEEEFVGNVVAFSIFVERYSDGFQQEDQVAGLRFVCRVFPVDV